MRTLTALLIIALIVPPALAEKKEKIACAGVAAGSIEKGELQRIHSAHDATAIDLWVLFPTAAKKQLEGLHTIGIDVFTPNGFLYDHMSLPVSTTDFEINDPLYLPDTGGRAPLRVMKEKEFKGAKHVGASVRLDIAGTAIGNNALYGTWSVKAYIDADREPCAAATTFVILP